MGARALVIGVAAVWAICAFVSEAGAFQDDALAVVPGEPRPELLPTGGGEGIARKAFKIFKDDWNQCFSVTDVVNYIASVCSGLQETIYCCATTAFPLNQYCLRCCSSNCDPSTCNFLIESSRASLYSPQYPSPQSTVAMRAPLAASSAPASASIPPRRPTVSFMVLAFPLVCRLYN